MVESYYLIQDPYHPYAISFMEAIKRSYPNYIPICIHTDLRLKFHFRRQYPISKMFPQALHVHGSSGSMGEIYRRLIEEYLIVGMVPWCEPVVSEVIEFLKFFPGNWNSSETIARFRDKHALKSLIYEVNPQLKYLKTFKVRDAQQMESIIDHLPDRYVVKPNSGYSNVDIGFFDKKSGLNEVYQYFDKVGSSRDYIIEPFLDGNEFAVNAQVDADGKIWIASIFQYERQHLNDRKNVYYKTWSFPQNHILFSKITKYCQMLVNASGLIRCPVHIELIDDHNYGLTLVEMACRPGGGGFIYASHDLHNNEIDLFELAAHFLFSEDSMDLQLNWDHYNRISLLDLDGVSDQKGIIYRISHKNKVEELPEFVRWTTEPLIGSSLSCTVDLETLPWALHLRSDRGKEYLDKLAEQVREDLVLNRPKSYFLKYLVTVKAFIHKVSEKLLWWASFQWRQGTSERIQTLNSDSGSSSRESRSHKGAS